MHVELHTFAVDIDSNMNELQSAIRACFETKILTFSLASSIELFSAHRGHFTSTTPGPQHSYSIKVSSVPPKKGYSILTKTYLKKF